MAKKGGKKREGYFQRNISQHGEHFLNMKTAENIKYDSRNIFRDIAFTSVDRERDKDKSRTCVTDIAPYFNNLTFVTNLYNAALSEFHVCNATCVGLQNYIVMAQNGHVVIDPSQHLEETMIMMQNKTYAYNIICMHLNNIISLFSFNGDDDWINANIEVQLKALSIQLSKYRGIL